MLEIKKIIILFIFFLFKKVKTSIENKIEKSSLLIPNHSENKFKSLKELLNSFEIKTDDLTENDFINSKISDKLKNVALIRNYDEWSLKSFSELPKKVNINEDTHILFLFHFNENFFTLKIKKDQLINFFCSEIFKQKIIIDDLNPLEENLNIILNNDLIITMDNELIIKPKQEIMITMEKGFSSTDRNLILDLNKELNPITNEYPYQRNELEKSYFIINIENILSRIERIFGNRKSFDILELSNKRRFSNIKEDNLRTINLECQDKIENNFKSKNIKENLDNSLEYDIQQIPGLNLDVTVNEIISNKSENYKDLNYKHKKFRNKNNDFQNSNLENLNLENSNFKNSNLENSNHENSNFENLNLENSNHENSNFENSNHENSNFENSNLENSNFENSNLENSNFENLNLENLNHENLNLENSNLENSNLRKIKKGDLEINKGKLTSVRENFNIESDVHSEEGPTSIDDNFNKRLTVNQLDTPNLFEKFKNELLKTTDIYNSFNLIDPKEHIFLSDQNETEDLSKRNESVSKSNEPVDLSNEPVDLSNEPVDLSNEPVDLSSKSVDLSNEPVGISTKSVDLSSEPVDFSGKSVDLYNEPVDLSNKPVGIYNEPVNLSSELVDLSSEPVDLSNKPVGIYNEPVDFPINNEYYDYCDFTINNKNELNDIIEYIVIKEELIDFSFNNEQYEYNEFMAFDNSEINEIEENIKTKENSRISERLESLNRGFSENILDNQINDQNRQSIKNSTNDNFNELIPSCSRNEINSVGTPSIKNKINKNKIIKNKIIKDKIVKNSFYDRLSSCYVKINNEKNLSAIRSKNKESSLIIKNSDKGQNIRAKNTGKIYLNSKNGKTLQSDFIKNTFNKSIENEKVIAEDYISTEYNNTDEISIDYNNTDEISIDYNNTDEISIEYNNTEIPTTSNHNELNLKFNDPTTQGSTRKYRKSNMIVQNYSTESGDSSDESVYLKNDSFGFYKKVIKIANDLKSNAKSIRSSLSHANRPISKMKRQIVAKEIRKKMIYNTIRENMMEIMSCKDSIIISHKRLIAKYKSLDDTLSKKYFEIVKNILDLKSIDEMFQKEISKK
ncbi:hypothetical protein DMUE_0672 [Dictyocoela muelleri]|nr:hypothetical protein DMUE_0672 [Dictyocoela muelleri]